MRNESKTISIGLKSIYHYFMAMLEENEPHIDQTTPTNESKQVAGPDQEAEKDPYLDVYSYLHMYWFI